jgi:hypothetical protein
MKKDSDLSKKRNRSESDNSNLSDVSDEKPIVKTKKTTMKPKVIESDGEDNNIVVGKDEITIKLEGKKKVSIRKFKGQIYVDIREYYEKDGEEKPSKKGISMKPELWEKLKSRISDIDSAIKNMKK